MRQLNINKVVYRLYTENTGKRREIENEVSNYFGSFTVYTGVGHWHGTEEMSLIIEIISDNEITSNGKRVYTLGESLRKLNYQESILITESPITTVEIR